MNKMKKVLLGMAPVLAISGMAATAISCGKTRFDQDYDGKLVIGSSFSDSNNQGKALKGVVEAYNKWLATDTVAQGDFPAMTAKEKTAKGYLPVSITTLTNGYNTEPLLLKLKSKDRTQFWNMLINYPAAAAILSYYDMNTSISQKLYDSLGIAQSFKNINENIPGNNNNEVWTVPLTRSSEMSSINKLVFGKMLSELKNDHSITLNGAKVNEFATFYETNTTDKTEVDNLWLSGKPKVADVAKSQSIITGFMAKMPTPNTITDDIFNSYDQLVTVAGAMKAMYPENDFSIIGLDSLPNAINLMTTAKTKGHPLNGYIAKDGKTFNYSAFLTKGTKQYNFFKGIVGNIINGIRSKAVQVFGEGAYGSNDLTVHKMGISIGSTAGYKHTFHRDGKGLTIYKYVVNTVQVNDPIFLVSSTKALVQDQVAFFTGDDGGHTNNVMNYNVDSTKVGKYNKKLASAAIATEIKKLITGATQSLVGKKPINAYGGLVSGTLEGDKLKLNSGSTITLTAAQKAKVKNLGKVFDGDEANFVFVPGSFFTSSSETKNSSQVLNHSEAAWLASPRTQDITKDKKAIWAQGPSLIPIHANDKEDKATQLFVKWLYKYVNPVVDIDGSTLNNITGVIALNKKGNYIAPTEAFLTDTTNASSMNEAERIAFDGFGLTISDPTNYIVASDVPSRISAKFRQIITSVAKNAFTSKTPITFEEFMKEVKTQFA